MASRTRRRVSASLLVMAAARAASAQTAATTYVSGTSSSDPSNPYLSSQDNPTQAAAVMATTRTLTLNAVLPNGSFITTNANSSTGFSYLDLYSSPNATPVVVGPASSTGNDFTSSAGNSVQTYASSNVNGAVAGQVTPYLSGSNSSNGGSFNTSTAAVGTDAFLYVPANAPGGAGTDIVIGSQGVLGATNATGAANGTIYYYYPLTTNSVTDRVRNITLVKNNGTASTVTSAPTAINANNQVILQATRYIGVGASSGVSNITINLGMDAFLFTPATNGSATGTTTPVGLTGNNYYYYSNTTVAAANKSNSAVNLAAYQTSTSAPVALNAAGAVVGTTNRYTANGLNYTSNAYSGVSPGGSAIGVDAWVYSSAVSLGTGAPAGSQPVGTVQVGLVGTTTPAALGGYYSYVAQFTGGAPSGTFETSGVVGISAAGAVTGTSNVYATNTTSAPFLGQEAWQFAPNVSGGATSAIANGYGTVPGVGTYTQLGLYSNVASGGIVYTAGDGTRSSAVAATNAAGNAAGTSNRYSAAQTANFGLGQDAWYYTPGGGVTNITPTANPSYSNYFSPTTSSGTAEGNFSSSSVVGAMGSSGVVAGTQNRYLSGTTTPIGQDAWAYNPATNTTSVIASPAIIANDGDFAAYNASGTASEYFNAAVKSVSDAGLVVGTFTANTSGGAAIGTYAYAWTPQAGTVVLGSVTNTSSAVAALTLNTSSGTMNISVGSIYADAGGDIFGLGYLAGGTTPEIYEFAAAPEPTSLALLALGMTPLLRGRRRRASVDPRPPVTAAAAAGRPAPTG